LRARLHLDAAAVSVSVHAERGLKGDGLRAPRHDATHPSAQ
jgi:hypothetical protein